MKPKITQYLAFLLLLCWSGTGRAMFNDDPWLTKWMSEFELSNEDGSTLAEWDIDVWSGRDLTKVWLKSSGEYHDSELESVVLELSLSQAVSPYWDRQYGVRHDPKPDPMDRTRSWLSFGYIGTAPYFIDVDARLFVGEYSSSQLLIEMEREFMLTQRWVLTSELDIVANGNTNEEFTEGSGLSRAEIELRLGYEPSRRLQPFLSLTHEQTFGRTRDLIRATGDDSDTTRFSLGIEMWF